MKRSITKLLCRAGIVAALYAVLTIPLGTLAFGSIGFQIRPAEALTMLPLFYVESIPALTFAAGRLIKNTPLKLIAGGIFPVLVNAFCIPLVLIWSGSAYAGYWFMFASLLLTQAVWVYALGVPLYFGIHALREKGVSAFCDNHTGEPLDAGH